MKFSCGLTPDGERQQAYANWENKLQHWHKIFAWLPVQIEVINGEKRCVWLEYYEARVPQWDKYWWYVQDGDYASSYIERRFLTKAE